MKHWRLDNERAPDEAFGRYVYRIGWKFVLALAIAAMMWVALYRLLHWFGV